MKHTIIKAWRKIRVGAFFLALFLCFGVASEKLTKAVVMTTKYGDKELPIYCVDTDEKKIAISFDAAWGAEDFDEIMKILEKHNVKTTFFMTGEWVMANPDCVKALVDAGHDLGNHSMNHPDMTTLSEAKMQDEILKVHELVRDLTGYEMKLFRPPYGAYDNKVIQMVYKLDYFPIQWSVDTLVIEVMF